jgi:competence protein ComGF
MPASPRAPATDKRALLRMQADLRRLNIIRTNQGKLVLQMQDLIARYNKYETLAGNVQKNVDDAIARIIDKLG